MRNLEKKLRAAIVQAAPVFFDKQATLQKVVHQIEEAGRNGAQLIVFPESLVPCYPYGLTFGFRSCHAILLPLATSLKRRPRTSAARLHMSMRWEKISK